MKSIQVNLFLIFLIFTFKSNCQLIHYDSIESIEIHAMDLKRIESFSAIHYSNIMKINSIDKKHKRYFKVLKKNKFKKIINLINLQQIDTNQYVLVDTRVVFHLIMNNGKDFFIFLPSYANRDVLILNFNSVFDKRLYRKLKRFLPYSLR